MKSTGQLALSPSLAAGGILSHSARMLPSESNINLSRVSMLHTKQTVLQPFCFLGGPHEVTNLRLSPAFLIGELNHTL